ncbi:MAG: hypothetical protein HY735_19715 [Verrucomicrobia bacterium]|nr:hypothetical protein [Verrucomicrobiota bacterium]
MNQIAKALALSKQALALINQEMERQDHGSGAVGTVSQLLTCKQQLQAMIAELESGSLPPKDERLRGMGHMIADSWPTDSTLADALLLAEQAYRSA